MKNIAIIGSGSWGVALAIHLAKLGNKIKSVSFYQKHKYQRGWNVQHHTKKQYRDQIL